MTTPMRVMGWIAVAGLSGLAACHQQEQAAAPPPVMAPPPAMTLPPTAPSPAAEALVAQLPAAYAKADLANGQLHFNLCRPCHTVVQGGPNMTGPNLYGVFGRRVASAPGFTYSAALKSKAWTWDADHLNIWLKSPREDVPGTKMTFYGIPDDQDRRDLIAYLKVASSGGPM